MMHATVIFILYNIEKILIKSVNFKKIFLSMFMDVKYFLPAKRNIMETLASVKLFIKCQIPSKWLCLCVQYVICFQKCVNIQDVSLKVLSIRDLLLISGS